MLKIIPVTKNLIDIFHGKEGWETWTRVQVERLPERPGGLGKRNEIILHPKKGVHLPQPVAHEVMQHVSSML